METDQALGRTRASLNGLSAARGDRLMGAPSHGHPFSMAVTDSECLLQSALTLDVLSPEFAGQTGFQQFGI